jgi:hypothetical protein
MKWPDFKLPPINLWSVPKKSYLYSYDYDQDIADSNSRLEYTRREKSIADTLHTIAAKRYNYLQREEIKLMHRIENLNKIKKMYDFINFCNTGSYPKLKTTQKQ